MDATEFPSLAMAPIFPLPDGALLPGEYLPLHVFETRYREMMEAVRASDRLLAIATLLPGWEPDYYGRPGVAEVVGVGRLVRDRLNRDGTSDIVLKGLARGLLLEELSGRTYRRARIRLVTHDDLLAYERFRHARRLLTGLGARLRRPLRWDLTQPIDPSALVDRIATLLELPAALRVAVLQSVELEDRITLLLEILSERPNRQRLLELVPSLHEFTLSLDPETSP